MKNNFKILLQLTGLSFTEISAKTGIHKNTISDINTGLREPPEKLLDFLAEELEVSRKSIGFWLALDDDGIKKVFRCFCVENSKLVDELYLPIDNYRLLSRRDRRIIREIVKAKTANTEKKSLSVTTVTTKLKKLTPLKREEALSFIEALGEK